MSLTGVHRDPLTRTLTLTAEFAAPATRVWRLWSDPRRLERWWGPPGHTMTVTAHELRPGGRVAYSVAERTGWWHVREVDAPSLLVFDLGDPEFPPIAMRVRLTEAAPDRTGMVIEARFPDGAAMDLMLSIGFDDGMATAVGQAADAL